NHPNVTILNEYGPTETTVGCTTHQINPNDPIEDGVVVIGRPMDGVRMYVLDKHLRPSAIGIAGEVYIAGDLLARGYTGRPDLTSERFVADPFGEPGTRMYRTGDLMRWNADGVLEFVSRVDDQVKVRGFRIELGEVSAALMSYDGVEQTAVIVREDQPGDKRLTAYVVSVDRAAAVDLARLREHAQDFLPEYMVPSAFVALDELPLTSNGKLDTKALPAPELAGGQGRAPRTPQEEILCGLFADVLGLPTVGIDDDFFALGGHSLLATRLTSQIRSVLRADLSIRAVFERPTVAALAHLLAESATDTGTTRPAVVVADRPAAPPLSFAQQRLWFLNQLDRTSATYNVPLALRLSGDLDVEALRAAVGDVLMRHESLRTLFPQTDGHPRQHVLPDVAATLPVTPVSEEELSAALAAEARGGFDLGVDLPVRARLFTTGASEAVLLLVVHHIAADGWSMAPLARDLSTAYAARADGREPAWQPLPAQYVDYALWQRTLLGSEDDPDSLAAAQLEFWKRELDGIPGGIDLPVDRRGGSISYDRAGSVPLRVPAHLHEQLDALARKSGTSMFMVVQAAFAVLLGKLGGGTDIPIGTPVAGRSDEALNDLVGFFVNTLVLRTDLSGNPTFTELLARVRESDLAAYAHQDLPFERLVEVLNPERSLDRHPLFQIMIMFQNNARASLTLSGLRVSPEPLDFTVSKFDLSLAISERRGQAGDHEGLEGSLDYRSDLFDAATVEAMAERLVHVLSTVAEAPGTRLDGLDVLTPVERSSVLVGWNDTAVEDAAGSVVERFEACAAAAPDAVAVSCGGRELTYGELAERSAQLARHLTALGAGPERLVAVALPRSPELLVALLAVLKSGAAYVPVDPGYPAERIAAVFTDAAPQAVLTCREIHDSGILPPTGPNGPTHLLLDNPDNTDHLPQQTTPAPAPDTAPAPAVAPAGVPLPADPAYVIYTSGSTGRPKGVVVTHANLANLLTAIQQRIPLTPTDNWLAVTTVAFDIAHLELFGPLTQGARVVLAATEEAKDPAALARLITTHHVTVMQATPTTWQMLTTHAPHTLHGLRKLTGGEALPPALANELHTAGDGDVLNVYGPTETTIWATADRVTDEGEGSVAVPIGTPLANNRVYVLDRSLHPVPVGVSGELYIAGAHVARGYHQRPDLTSERFLADPFGPLGSRMYRTGDLVRWRADGRLEYLGRTDHQVKVRGHRIELGEIESVLSGSGLVEQSAVVVREDQDGDKRITAYVVPRRRERDQAQERQQVENWSAAYDAYYGNPASTVLGEDFGIWNDSYGGEPIPADEMRQWRAAAVDRIRALRPRRVLEIGVGTGLILAHVAPHCEAYWGTDVSPVVIDTLRKQVAAVASLSELVELRTQPAHDVTGLPEGFFDTIVLNSVIQYFPSGNYLAEVLESVSRLLAPGGSVFIGDVRHRRLHRGFAASVALHQAEPGADTATLLRAVEQGMAREQELLVDPEFFTGFAGPGALVDVRTKDGAYDNELTRYRYDVVLRPGTVATTAADAVAADAVAANAVAVDAVPQLLWGLDLSDVDGLTAVLAGRRPETLRVVDVPNARLTGHLAALRALDAGTEPGNIADDAAGDRTAVPTHGELEAVATAYGYRVAVTWSATGGPGRLDAVFVSEDTAGGASGHRMWSGVYGPVAETAAGTFRPGLWTNTPHHAVDTAPLLAEVRAQVQRVLPEYMVPAAFVTLDRLPLTPNGKLDRKALPKPEVAAGSGRTPSGPLQEILCGLFADVLGVEGVGVDDDFFALGGHSLLATRLASRVRTVLGRELDLRVLFEAPTVAELASRLDGSSEVRAPLATRTRPEPLPLSFAQRRLWFLGRYGEAGAAYNMPLVIRLSGTLDEAALRAAVGDVADRHEALRTMFGESEGEPFQDIRPTGQDVPFEVTTCTADELAGRLAEASRHVFDLAAEIPLRVTVLRTGEGEWVLLVLTHHIASDGWSTAPFLKDLGHAYTARLGKGAAPAWKDLPVQYADYTLWQQDLLGDPADPASLYARQLGYWKQNLTGAPEELTLPFDRPRPAEPSHQGAMALFDIDTTTHRQLAALARSTNTSMFMVFQVAIAATLTRLGAGTDIPIGIPIAGRTDDALEDLVGFFVNTLVLRTDTTGNPTFRTLLARVRDTDLAAYAHQDLPFESLVEALNPQRTLTRHPLFQTMLAYHNTSRATLELPGLELEPILGAEAPALVDLAFNIAESHGDGTTPAGISGGLQYATDLFDRATAERITTYLTRLLTAAATHPDAPLHTLGMVPEAELVQLTGAGTGISTPTGTSVPLLAQVFEEQVRRTPQAPAVTFEGVTLTFEELNERANRLAHYLIGRGAAPERTVALNIPRSVEMVIGLLGTLKSGAAYLPIDPDYPADRVAYMLATTEPLLTLTSLPDTDGLPSGNPEVLVRPDHPVYTIYTSGSTGRPKGVVVTHGSLANVFHSHQDYLHTEEHHRQPGQVNSALIASISFDASWDPLMWLFGGHRLHVLSTDVARNAKKLVDYIADESVHFIDVTPSYFAELMEYGLLEEGRTELSMVMVGGEAIGGGLWQQLRDNPRLCGCNYYAPSECTVDSLGHHTSDGDRPMLGSPVRNTRVYVLDDLLCPVPSGVAGELYVAGEGLARGYVNQPGRTAERFTADPFGAPGARMYRTGDLVRRNTDGTLEFLGRVDDQVKVRGFRIELGEIEAALGAHPAVAQCSVIVREDRPGDLRLAAYVVPAVEPALPHPEDLRGLLRESLPEYMVPSAFVVMDRLPLTANGKLDRKALPVPDYAPAAGSGRGPRNPHEEILCALFAEVLGLAKVGIDDDFFELGGHSLLATRLVSRVRSRVGVELSIRALFDAPTVAGIAPHTAATGAPKRPALTPRRRPTPTN
ncbi:amino acid adenylation domain-containing protein, partial [Streptomyces sp. NPDC000594]|uniref:amino acid adenylation domain-containing protein n=1 Tax=Streptomyces sp. NPDC000594 TaxID=3154261 RepID=UPI003322D017